MIRPLLIAAAALALAAPALARDARLATRAYNAEEVVRIEGRLNVQATIAFAEDEHIENVAIGDSTSWQVTPNKRANLLFVKPLSARARTNMTVVTDKRTYYFDLATAAAGNPVYALRFTYPDAPKPAVAATSVPGLTAEETQAVSGAPAERPVDPATLNFAWEARGEGKLLPARVYDDGQATFVSWPAKAQIPAILIRDAKGAEGPVNFAVRGDVIVIDGVPPLIVLRAGRSAATLVNKGPVRAEPAATALAANRGN
jgi:type IV secretion system protein VirB9